MICCRASGLDLWCLLCLETFSLGSCLNNFPDIQLTNHTSSSINLNCFCHAIEANYCMIEYSAELQKIKFPSAIFWIRQGSIGVCLRNAFPLLLQVVAMQFALRLFSEEGDDQCCQSVSLNALFYQMKISLKVNLDSLQSGLIFITVDMWSYCVSQSQKEQLALYRLLRERSSVLGGSIWDI